MVAVELHKAKERENVWYRVGEALCVNRLVIRNTDLAREHTAVAWLLTLMTHEKSYLRREAEWLKSASHSEPYSMRASLGTRRKKWRRLRRGY